MQSRSRKPIFILITISIAILAAEVIGFAGCLILGDDFFAPEPTRAEFAVLLQKQYEAENYDATLGWVTPKLERDANGARPSPDNPASGRPCLSLYGDSFVFGNGANDAAAWANQLAKKLKCKVLNFGVVGYGTDQAFLRFAGNLSDPSSVVVLGIMSENIVRNANQNRAFLYAGSIVGPLKPVFWLSSAGQLHLLPVQKLTAGDYDTYLQNPRALFTREFFIPESSDYALPSIRFPYVISLINLFRYRRIDSALLYYVTKGPEWYRDFYDLSHASRALQLTETIVDSFVELAKQRAKTPIIMFIPPARDIGHFLKSGQWIYRPLYEWCRAKNYVCFDAGTAMVEKLGPLRIKDTGVCEYFCTNRLTQSGHYNAKGHAILADATLRFLRDYALEARAVDGASP
jgi:hypothetical protein